MNLATIEQLADKLGTTLEPTDAKADRALLDASALIRASLGQIVNLVEDDLITIDGLGLRGLVLPQIPVVEVSDVTLLGANEDEVLAPTDFYVDTAGILWRSTSSSWGWGWGWPTLRGNVQVTYTHGYEVIPDEAVALCLSIAARSYASAASAGQIVTSQTIGGASVTYSDSVGGTNARGLTSEEEALLQAYPWPSLVPVEG